MRKCLLFPISPHVQYGLCTNLRLKDACLMNNIQYYGVYVRLDPIYHHSSNILVLLVY